MAKLLSRRGVLRASTAALAASSLSCYRGIPGVKSVGRPEILGGVGSGDVTHDRAMIRSATDRPARMLIEWSTSDSFRESRRVVGPDAVSRSGYTAKFDLAGLPPDTRIFYRVRFENLDDYTLSDPAVGSFRTAQAPAGAASRDVTIAFSGDTAGQGWGIDPSRGGMPVYSAMARMNFDALIHSGDNIYADIPIPPEKPIASGGVWKNLITDAKSKPAQTLEEFRGAYAYNLMDEAVRAFCASTPVLAQWDDHEVRNNWYPGQILDDPKYTEKDINVLAPRARQAFLEYMPIRPPAEDPMRIYRRVSCGPLAEVFLLDQRSYRGPNTPNRQEQLTHDADFLGAAQLDWFKKALASSKAVWKIVASDMPFSCIANDGPKNYEAWANGDHGKPLGRELELVDLFTFIKTQKIRNVVYVTADVHHAASIHYHPDRAAWKDFHPFWEFISGPLHAGGFGPSKLDMTFGPERKWYRAPAKAGLGPGDGFAHFSAIRIDAKSKAARVTHYGIDGAELSHVDLRPES